MKIKDTVVKTYSDHVSPGKVDIYTKFNMVIVPGKRGGCFIYDIEGKRYFNCHSNGGVFNLGHRNARIIRAVTEAMKSYDIGNHHLISRPKAELAKALAETLPQGLNQVVYGVGGGEAVDLAIKLARGVTGRTEIISARGGYHGHTGLAIATGDKKFSEKFGPPASGFRQIEFNDIKQLDVAVSEKTAAVIFETIPATLGIIVPDKNYFKSVKKICESRGTLLILDEVQTGFGRTGTMWGFEQFGVVPDMIVMGKGMSGGIYPITATVYQKKYADFLRSDPFVHISTFGGSEIGCYAALEVLKITRNKGFLDHVKSMGKYFSGRLKQLSRRYPTLKLQVRGIGLMMGLEFKDETTALFMMKIFLDNGIYVVYSSNDPKILQFLPVLVITEKQGDEIVRLIERSFKTMTGL
jgi:putrescine aminotransferase